MKKYIVRKCNKCGLWHVFIHKSKRDIIFFKVFISFETWSDFLMVLNFPDQYLSKVK